MRETNIYYEEELTYNRHRLIAIVLLILFSFGLYAIAPTAIHSDIPLQMGFLLIAVLLLSALHYALLLSYPDRFPALRKTFLIVVDIALLTYVLLVVGREGIYLFLFYVLIVMGSAFRLGTVYFYAAVFFSILSWGTLLYFSKEWLHNSDFVAAFALVTIVIPYFYLDTIMHMREEKEFLSQELDSAQYESALDPLTGIPNRKAFQEACEAYLETKEPFALLFIDLNKFKPINDTYGHQVGDQVLKYLTSAMVKMLTEEDFIARLGGDEFVILLSRKAHAVKEFVWNLENNIIGTPRISGIEIPLSISIGISLYPENGLTEKRLTECADKAMYYAKNDERRYHYFCDEVAQKPN